MTIFLGEKIKNLRQEKKISQITLSNEILSRSTLSKIENNKILPSLEQLIYLADQLNVSMSYFFDNQTAHTEVCSGYKTLNEFFENKRFFDIINDYENRKKNFELIDYYFVGMSYFNIEDFDNASKSLKKFISQYKNQDQETKLTYVEQVAIALNTLTKVILKNKNFKKALKYLYIADNYLKSYNNINKRIYFVINNNISSIYCILNEYILAKEHLQKFIDENCDFYYNNVMGSIYLNLNISCFKLCEYENSINYVKKAIFYYNLTNRTYDEGESYLNYINALRYLYRFEEALVLIESLCVNPTYSKELIELFKLQNLIISYNTQNIYALISKYILIDQKLLRKKSLMDYYFICGYVEYINLNFKKSHANFLKCEPYLLKNNRYLDLSVMYEIFSEILDAEEYKIKSNHYKNLYYSSNSSLSVNITLPD